MPDAWHPAGEWHALGPAYYRRTTLYELPWPVEHLEQYWVASSSDGALLRDPTQLVAVAHQGAAAPKIQVYTGAGQLLETFPVCGRLIQWDGPRVVQLGFTWRDELAVVTDEGAVRVYGLFEPSHAGAQRVEATSSSHYTVLSLGESAAEIGVARAQVLPTAVCGLLRDGSVVLCNLYGVHEDGTTDPPWAERGAPPLPRQFAPVPGGGSSITAWSVCAATHTVWVATPDTLYALRDGTYAAIPLEAPLDAVRASPNGKLLALLAKYTLRVVHADTSAVLRAWDVRASDAYQTCVPAAPILAPLEEPTLAPRVRDKGGIGGTGVSHLAWCGDDTVALAWRDAVRIVGPCDDPIALRVSGATHLFDAADGVRMIHAAAHEYVDKVDFASEAVLRPGSTHVATLLVDAAQLAHKCDPRAYEAVQAMHHDLVFAVEQCVAAAAQAWDVHTQQTLLKAALFGKSFLDAYDPSTYLHVARMLRVLNAVRDYRVGIPARYATLHEHGPAMLLYGLCLRQMHHTAARICTYLQVRPDEVLQHWARAKVARAPSSASTENLAASIVAKFEAAGALNYAEIALVAWQAGRLQLATTLLRHEARAVGQVPLLLRMRAYRLALQRAVECGDPDLVYYVLFRLQQQMSRGEFFRVVQAPLEEDAAPLPSATVGVRPPSNATYAPLAACLLVCYAREQDPELLRDFYYLDDRRVAQALLCLAHAPRDAARYAERVQALRHAAKHFSEDRARTQEAQLSEDHASLLGFQAGLDAELAAMGARPTSSLVGQPLVRTMEVCIQHGLHQRAERLRQEYKVSDRMYFFAKVHALVACQDWAALAAHVGRRPPVGFAPLVRTLLHAGHVHEACHYARLGATDKGNRAALQELQERCPKEEHRTRLRAALSTG